MVAKASTLVSVADVLLPGLHRRLTAVTPFLGTRGRGVVRLHQLELLHADFRAEPRAAECLDVPIRGLRQPLEAKPS
jgi:hypothetical protein